MSCTIWYVGAVPRFLSLNYINQNILCQNEFNSQLLSNSNAISCRASWFGSKILLPSSFSTSDNHTISVMPVRNVELWVSVVSRDVRISLGCDSAESLKSVSSGKRTQQRSRYQSSFAWSLCPWSASRKNWMTLCFAMISDCIQLW